MPSAADRSTRTIIPASKALYCANVANTRLMVAGSIFFGGASPLALPPHRPPPTPRIAMSLLYPAYPATPLPLAPRPPASPPPRPPPRPRIAMSVLYRECPATPLPLLRRGHPAESRPERQVVR